MVVKVWGDKLKKITVFFSLLALLLVASGCLFGMNDQKISVQKRTGQENIFEDFKEITEKRQVEKAIDIVENAAWENEKLKMEDYADYQFQFPFKNNNSSEDKIASYLLWISSNGEDLMIVTDSNKYVKLTKQDSAHLYEILTEKPL